MMKKSRQYSRINKSFTLQSDVYFPLARGINTNETSFDTNPLPDVLIQQQSIFGWGYMYSDFSQLFIHDEQKPGIILVDLQNPEFYKQRAGDMQIIKTTVQTGLVKSLRLVRNLKVEFRFKIYQISLPLLSDDYIALLCKLPSNLDLLHFFNEELFTKKEQSQNYVLIGYYEQRWSGTEKNYLPFVQSYTDVAKNKYILDSKQFSITQEDPVCSIEYKKEIELYSNERICLFICCPAVFSNLGHLQNDPPFQIGTDEPMHQGQAAHIIGHVSYDISF